jgi:hypothetical protein
MSTEQDKFKHSKRLLKDENAIKKQTKIGNQHGMSDKEINQPHRLVKRHAMDCGNPKCAMCGNPRKTFKELTQQEKRLFQDTEKATDKRSNGLKNDKADLL